jgi:ATP-dependent Clp protease ATP-binding subunit ClpC
MFERFTNRARRVVVLAQEEARRLEHNYIGTEHILLGLLREDQGAAATALAAANVTLDGARLEVETIIGRGKHEPTGHIPFTPRAKKVLELSLREAVRLGHDYIDTGHILLGLIREGDGVAVQVMVNLGADPKTISQRVVLELGGDISDDPVTVRTRFGTRQRQEVQDYPDTIAGLRAEIARLRAVLNEHGIDPGEPAGPAGPAAAAE